KLVLLVDGAPAAEKAFPGTGKDNGVTAVLEAKVPAGPHEVKVENTGEDWVRVRQFELEPYASTLGVMGRAGKDFAALWISNRTRQESGGKLSVAGLQSGSYHATWWDTSSGKSLS